MKVTVLDNNGKTTDYYFDPAHTLPVWDFYKNQMESGLIKAFTATSTSN